MTIPMASSVEQVEVIKTDTFLDKSIGLGGIPRGKLGEIFGDQSVGKSTVCFQAIAAAQAQGLRCLFADIEWSYDANYAKNLGVDSSKLGLIRERFAEDALDALESAVESGQWDLVILDSIGALLPRSEAEKGAGEKTIGGQAGLVAKFCRKIIPLLSLRNTALVVLNHSFVDIMSGRISTSGGKKLEYHKSWSIRLKVDTTKALKVGDRKVGKVVIAETRKNKLASTEGHLETIQLVFGDGFSKSANLLQDALDAGIFERTGNTFYFQGEKLGMISKVREMMKDELFSEKVQKALA